MEKVCLTTEDNFKIYGNYLYVKESQIAVLLLHMMPATKESWLEFQNDLASNKISSLALDMRGHGESLIQHNGSSLSYQNFTDLDHQKKINDVKAGVDFLINQGFKKEKIALCGASIGANLSLWYASLNPEIKAVVLLSPGLNYRGITTDDKLKKLNNDQNVLLASGGDLDKYSKETVEKLNGITTKAKKELFVFEDAEHGTNIFVSHPEFKEKIINWILDIYK